MLTGKLEICSHYVFLAIFIQHKCFIEVSHFNSVHFLVCVRTFLSILPSPGRFLVSTHFVSQFWGSSLRHCHVFHRFMSGSLSRSWARYRQQNGSDIIFELFLRLIHCCWSWTYSSAGMASSTWFTGDSQRPDMSSSSAIGSKVFFCAISMRTFSMAAYIEHLWLHWAEVCMKHRGFLESARR